MSLAALSSQSVRTFISALQRRELELCHLHQCLHYALDLPCIAISHPVPERARHNLPREPVFVFWPSALNLAAAAGHELLPIVICLLLRLAIDHKRYRFREFEIWLAI